MTMDDYAQYRGYDRAKYDLTDPYAAKYVARDKALHDANVALVANAIKCCDSCSKGHKCATKK
jgi:hypothetical protein